MTKKHLGLWILAFFILISGAVAQIETPCVKDDDCQSLYVCVESKESDTKVCKHKDLFPITIREIITILLLMFIAGPAHGLGAGSILTPILLIGMNYTAGESTMIMYSLILGGSFGAFLNAFWRRNPKTGKPVIDYDMVMIIMPLVLLGVGIGVTIKLAAPQVAIILALMIIEINTIKKLIRKMRESTAPQPALMSTSVSLPLLAPDAEQLKIEGAEQIEGIGNIELKELKELNANIDLKKEEAKQEERIRQEQKARNEGSQELQAILNEDRRLFPLSKFFWIFGLLAWVITMTVLRSGRIFISVSHCSFRYWGLFALQLIGCLFFFVRNKRAVVARCDVKRVSGISSDADFLLKETILSEFSQVAIIAGGLAGFLGIGAGVIMTPYLLAYGCPPGVVGPTMSFGIVQSSFIAMATSLMLYSDLDLIQMGFFFALAVLGSYVINRLISFLVGLFKQPFITLWIMIAITGSSLIIMPVYTVWKSIEDPAQMLQYRWIC